ncbi:neuropeptide FF receptor 1-like isoform X2 [Stylophora pistillata]|uniref:neuropeptide FF receptor 1-like isoform X2 n=1 Tax=Stylophora pistillata TaxID=50429 RepID=UPI000C03CE5F|nr:neuropeptide FF receptor 1-like isoform X2 [Stylophora pistillata]
MAVFHNGSNGIVGNDSDLPKSPISLKLQIGMTFAYVIIFIVSLVGNALMIYVIHKTPRLRTTTNLLVANMAVADLLITFFAMPSSVMYLYLQHLWLSGVIGDITCKVVQYGLTLSIAASILTHVLIAIDRFICVVLPFKRVEFFKKIRTSYALTWFASLVLMSPYLIVYESLKLPNGKGYDASDSIASKTIASKIAAKVVQ